MEHLLEEQEEQEQEGSATQETQIINRILGWLDRCDTERAQARVLNFCVDKVAERNAIARAEFSLQTDAVS